jgi:hypothetical protein
MHFSDKEVWFDSIIGTGNSGIVNGPEYKLSAKGTWTHPFFLAGETSGKIKTKENTYLGSIKYDVYAQVLVLKYFNSNDNANLFIELEELNISEFEIFGHRFKNFEGRGFHDALLEIGNLSLVARRTKKTFMNERMIDFRSVDFFYLLEGENWKPLRNTASITKLADSKDKLRALRKFMRGERVKRNGAFDEAKLVKVITFYNTLRK